MGQMQIWYSSTDSEAVMPGKCLIHLYIIKEDYNPEVLFCSQTFWDCQIIKCKLEWVVGISMQYNSYFTEKLQDYWLRKLAFRN